jgi:hypothetical protein
LLSIIHTFISYWAAHSASIKPVGPAPQIRRSVSDSILVIVWRFARGVSSYRLETRLLSRCRLCTGVLSYTGKNEMRRCHSFITPASYGQETSPTPVMQFCDHHDDESHDEASMKSHTICEIWLESGHIYACASSSLTSPLPTRGFQNPMSFRAMNAAGVVSVHGAKSCSDGLTCHGT